MEMTDHIGIRYDTSHQASRRKLPDAALAHQRCEEYCRRGVLESVKCVCGQGGLAWQRGLASRQLFNNDDPPPCAPGDAGPGGCTTSTHYTPTTSTAATKTRSQTDYETGTRTDLSMSTETSVPLTHSPAGSIIASPTAAQVTDTTTGVGDGLSSGTVIGLGVGIGVGVAALVALVAMLCLCHRRRQKRGLNAARYVSQASDASIMEASRGVPTDQSREMESEHHGSPDHFPGAPPYAVWQTEFENKAFQTPVSAMTLPGPQFPIGRQHEDFGTPVSAMTSKEQHLPTARPMSDASPHEIFHTPDSAATSPSHHFATARPISGALRDDVFEAPGDAGTDLQPRSPVAHRASDTAPALTIEVPDPIPLGPHTQTPERQVSPISPVSPMASTLSGSRRSLSLRSQEHGQGGS